MSGVRQSVQLGKVLLALKGEQKGLTASEIAAKAKIPVGTASGLTSTLCGTKTLHVIPGAYPKRYLLSEYGGDIYKPQSYGSRPRSQDANGSGVGRDVRVVVTINGERRSMTLKEAKKTYYQAKALYFGLKELF